MHLKLHFIFLRFAVYYFKICEFSVLFFAKLRNFAIQKNNLIIHFSIMIKSKTIYITSLLFFAISIFLLIEYQDSQRMQLVAGMLTFVSFVSNGVAYFLKK